jgi:hypothetical protein
MRSRITLSVIGLLALATSGCGNQLSKPMPGQTPETLNTAPAAGTAGDPSSRRMIRRPAARWLRRSRAAAARLLRSRTRPVRRQMRAPRSPSKKRVVILLPQSGRTAREVTLGALALVGGSRSRRGGTISTAWTPPHDRGGGLLSSNHNHATRVTTCDRLRPSAGPSHGPLPGACPC